MLSTLIRGGFTYEDLESPELTKMLDILGRSFEVEKGVLGFGTTPWIRHQNQREVANGSPSPLFRTRC